MGTSATPIGRDESAPSEQRQSERKVISEQIAIELPPGKEAWLHDLGEGGLSVSSTSPLELGTATSFRFELSEANAIIDAAGVVVWTNQSGRSGFRFTRVEPNVTAALRRWLDSGASERPASSDLPVTDAELAGKVASLREVADLQAIISSEQLELAAALDLIARRMTELTRATGAAIALREGQDVVCRASSGNAPDVGVKLSSSSLSGECLRTGNVVLLEDSENDARVDPAICRQLDFRSLLILPINNDNAPIGIAEVLSPKVRNFEGGDVLVLSFLTDLIASVAAAQAPAVKSAISEVPVQPREVSTPQSRHLAPSRSVVREVPRPQPPTAFPVARKAAAAPYVVERKIASPTGVQRLSISWRLLPTAILIGLLVIASVGSSYYFLRNSAASTKSATRDVTPGAPVREPAAGSPEPTPVYNNSSVSVPSTAAKPARTTPARTTTTQGGPKENATAPELKVIQGHTLGVTPAPDSAPEPVSISALGTRAPEPLPAAIVTAKFSNPEVQLTQSQGVTPGRLLKKVMPRYPEMARRAGVSGDVIIAAIIGTDGALHNLRVTSGSPLLREEAITAAKQWRYSPYLLGGKPVETDTHITISFHH